LQALAVVALVVVLPELQLLAGLPETLPVQEQPGLQQSQNRVAKPVVPPVGGVQVVVSGVDAPVSVGVFEPVSWPVSVGVFEPVSWPVSVGVFEPVSVAGVAESVAGACVAESVAEVAVSVAAVAVSDARESVVVVAVP
jgi:hypothetical protein